MPVSSEQPQTAIQKVNDDFLKKTVGLFSGSAKPEMAGRAMGEAKQDVRFHVKSRVNSYEKVFEESQETIRNDLRAEFQQYIMDLFDGCQNLKLPILEGIRKSVADI